MYKKAVIHTLFIWYVSKQLRPKADSGCGCDDGPIIHGYGCGGGVVKVWESFNWHQLGLLLHVDLWMWCQQSWQSHGSRSGVWFTGFPAWSLILYLNALKVDTKYFVWPAPPPNHRFLSLHHRTCDKRVRTCSLCETGLCQLQSVCRAVGHYNCSSIYE